MAYNCGLSRDIRFGARNMILISCDNCGEICAEDRIKLEGYLGNMGGILLPEKYHKKDFCGKKCFENWIKVALSKEE